MTRMSERRPAFFMALAALFSDALNEARLDRQLGRRKRERLARDRLRHAVDLKHDAARRNTGHPEFRRALALAHAHFDGLLRHRNVREHTDPDAARALHVTGERAASGLDLARGDALRLHRLQSELTEIERKPALRIAMNAAFKGFTELGFLWLHHDGVLSAPRPLTGFALARLAARTMGGGMIGFGQALVLGHGIVLEDLALEDPDLDAAGAIGGVCGGDAIVDVGAQGVQRHATLAIPFETGDLRAAQSARAIDADALRAEAHRRLHRALHRAAERHPTLELLSDRLGDQGRVDFRLTDFDDVDRDLRIGQLGNLLAELFDVGPLLCDDYAQAGRGNVDARLLVRTLDDDLRNRRLLEALGQRRTDLHVLVQELAVLGLAREPARIPGAVDAEAQPDRIDFLSHLDSLYAALASAAAATSRTMIVMLANGFSIRPARPRARGLKRFNTRSLPTQAWATTRSSTSRSWLFSALAIADSSVFLTSTEILFLENSRSASAVATFLPRMSWATTLSFCGLTRSMRVVALASFSA